MPFKPPEQAKCPKCGKSVYAAEERIGAGQKWHKFCFVCGVCSKMLDSTTVAAHDGLVYCKNCHGKSFGPKGYGFGGGAGALSTETGAQHGVKKGEMSNKPTEGHVGVSTGPGPHCPRCGKTVYENEKAIGLSIAFHKSCSKCKSCNKSIDYNTMSEHEGDIYCKGCYAKNFGPHGFGVGSLA
ncbi:cysteine and glycine-rich protein 1-like [Mizuhopecten yessoensis]|uniref:Cysteine and glycine-rich protein 2 n=1 Tax=Mizuhopecten yessoensis TaxID=6573 RepID=A0A210Q3B9_MIZYE|nr:cysteine and glycine-rich protein 1-like [Mizuhopecten yessoensis]OWF43243.1 Cysteine and glycine-rich protein 2 [Mizuhopecten yessoensis]